jgi:predicted nucleotidyltransferase
MMELDLIMNKIKYYLEQKYDCHTIILYGSFSSGDFTDESDLDLVCFSDTTDDINDVGMFDGIPLDVWVYHTDKMKSPDQFLRINKGKVLSDKRGLAFDFLAEIERIFIQGPKTLTVKEAEFLKNWIKKMHIRSNKDDIEGNYRLYWLLKDSLEIYFELKGMWYMGPKKAIFWLKENDEVAYQLFDQVYKKEVNDKNVQQLLNFLYHL